MSMWFFTACVLVAATGGGFLGWWLRGEWEQRAVPTWAGEDLLDDPDGLDVSCRETDDAVTKPVNPARKREP